VFTSPLQVTGCVDEDFDASEIGGSASSRATYLSSSHRRRQAKAKRRSAPYLGTLVLAFVAYLLFLVLSLEVMVVIGIVVALLAAVVLLMYMLWAVRWALSLTPWAEGWFEAGSPHWIPMWLYTNLKSAWCWISSFPPLRLLWFLVMDVYQSVGGYMVQYTNFVATSVIITLFLVSILGVPTLVAMQLSQESAAFAERTWVTHNGHMMRLVQVG